MKTRARRVDAKRSVRSHATWSLRKVSERVVAMTLFAGAVLSSGLGCGSSPPSPSAAAPSEEIAELAVRPVAFRAAGVDVGAHVTAVAETSDGVSAVFSEKGATLLFNGSILAIDSSTTSCVKAAQIPDAAGDRDRVVCVTSDGRVLRLEDTNRFEDVSDRYGLANDSVKDVASLGTGVGFALGTALAIARDGVLTRYDDPAFTSVEGGGGRAATIDGDAVRVLDPESEAETSYPLSAVRNVAFDAAGKLVAATSTRVYVEDASGTLVRRFDSGGAEIHGIARAKSRIWFNVGTELGVIEGDLVSISHGANVASGAALTGSPSGDVWAISGGSLARYAVDTAPPSDDEARWTANVQPIVQRTCSQCHLPGGTAGIELTTYTSWVARRAAIQDRVVDKKTMPPSGIDLPDAERQTIADWISGK